ncbi:MAG: hypothetical protein GY909_03840 [Oligoflexia bacterium]|nr:hypothetical protein [Oligoflexia bacterium]
MSTINLFILLFLFSLNIFGNVQSLENTRIEHSPCVDCENISRFAENIGDILFTLSQDQNVENTLLSEFQANLGIVQGTMAINLEIQCAGISSSDSNFSRLLNENFEIKNNFEGITLSDDDLERLSNFNREAEVIYLKGQRNGKDVYIQLIVDEQGRIKVSLFEEKESLPLLSDNSSEQSQSEVTVSAEKTSTQSETEITTTNESFEIGSSSNNSSISFTGTQQIVDGQTTQAQTGISIGGNGDNSEISVNYNQEERNGEIVLSEGSIQVGTGIGSSEVSAYGTIQDSLNGRTKTTGASVTTVLNESTTLTVDGRTTDNSQSGRSTDLSTEVSYNGERTEATLSHSQSEDEDGDQTSQTNLSASYNGDNGQVSGSITVDDSQTQATIQTENERETSSGITLLTRTTTSTIRDNESDSTSASSTITQTVTGPQDGNTRVTASVSTTFDFQESEEVKLSSYLDANFATRIGASELDLSVTLDDQGAYRAEGAYRRSIGENHSVGIGVTTDSEVEDRVSLEYRYESQKSRVSFLFEGSCELEGCADKTVTVGFEIKSRGTSRPTSKPSSLEELPLDEKLQIKKEIVRVKIADISQYKKLVTENPNKNIPPPPWFNGSVEYETEMLKRDIADLKAGIEIQRRKNQSSSIN